MRPLHPASGLPSVTCVVTAHDYERYVGRAIESVLAQDYPAELLDVVVVDDGSTDGTAAAVERIAATAGGRVTLVRRGNGGLAAASSTALEHARGDLIGILDADDLWLPGKLRAQVPLFDRPEVGLVYGDVQVIGPDDEVLEPSFFGSKGIVPSRGRVLERLLEVNFTTNSSLLFRAAHGDRFRPIPAWSPYADYWILVQIAAVAELDFVPHPVAAYRRHGANMGFGTSGSALVEELRRELRFLRGILTGPLADQLSTETLLARATDYDRRGAGVLSAARSPFVDLVPVPAAERVEARAVLGAAHAEPDAERALRLAIRAWFLDPYDAEARETLGACATRFGERPVPLPAGSRGERLVIHARADELAARPSLLAAYCHAVGADDEATLAIVTPGDPEQATEAIARAFVAAGVDPDAGPDMLLVSAAQAPRADALLSEAPADGLPAFGEARVAELRALLAAPRRPRARERRALLVVEKFHPSVGGTERLAEDLGLVLQRAGWRVDVAAEPDPRRPDGAEHRGMGVHEVVPSEVESLRAVADRCDADVLVAFSYPTGWPVLATLLQPADRRRVVVPCVNEVSYRIAAERPGFLPRYRELLLGADAVGVSSHAGWDAALARELGIDACYLPNAVAARTGSGAFRAEHGIAAGEPLLLHVGNLWPEKNHLELLETFAGMPGGLRLVLIGRPSPEHADLGARIDAAAAADPRVLRIADAGPDEVAAAMAASDLLLLPSRAEATPLVLLEAMTHGLPWLATPTVRSAADLCGGVVAPLDRFPGHVRTLLARPEDRAALGAAGREHWERCYAWEVVGPRYLAVLDGRPLEALEPPAPAQLRTRQVTELLERAA